MNLHASEASTRNEWELCRLLNTLDEFRDHPDRLGGLLGVYPMPRVERLELHMGKECLANGDVVAVEVLRVLPCSQSAMLLSLNRKLGKRHTFQK